jgi:hypothetical protein
MHLLPRAFLVQQQLTAQFMLAQPSQYLLPKSKLATVESEPSSMDPNLVSSGRDFDGVGHTVMED